MTSLTLTIGGNNFLPQYQTNSAQITNQIQNQGDTLDMTIIVKSGQSAPQVGQEIIFKDGSRYLFGGFVTKLTPVEYGVGQVVEYALEATDYTYLIINKSAQRGYANQTLSYIVNDLMSTYVDAGYSMSTSGVQTGPNIVTVTFNHITLRKCFEKLATLTNFIWWIGYDKVIHFIDPNTAAFAPEQITDTSKNIQSMVISNDCSQVRNDIVVIGGQDESSNYTQYFLGDTVSRAWNLIDSVITMVGITLNGVSKTVGIDPTDDETLFYFMYNPTAGSFRMSSGSPTPSGTDQIDVVFTHPLPVIVEVKDAGAIAYMKALEGGDGIHSYMMTDNTITSSAQGRQAALNELQLYAYPLLTGEFLTRTGLLQAGSYWTAGTAIQVNMPSWGINALTTYIIQKVVTTLNETNGYVEYTYDVTFGGRQLGVVNFLQYLAEPEDPLDTSQIIQDVFSFDETITTSDAFIAGTDTTETETITTTDSFTNNGLNYGTIFVAGPFAPSGFKRQFLLNSSPLG